ncbi:DUF6113 family protein [Actinotalea subterranea]|uniref:DUF6113 family protein n=1 Tax=Actinotalea subterranea TaxID=2607497 RepID=UPI001FE3DD79|nr:DUF6113 family protein [Actinotalea subterranea]
MTILNGRVLARLAAMGLLGVVVGVVGTVVHRWHMPWGLVLALASVLSASVVARAWTGWAGMLSVGLGVALAVGVLAVEGPGGDVLVAAQPVGYVWYGGALVTVLAGLLPARWFSERPVGRAPQAGGLGT